MSSAWKTLSNISPYLPSRSRSKKRREIGTTIWESREAARADVFRFIEVEYNRTRLRKHPEFGYLTPLESRAGLQHDFTPQRKHTLSKIKGELQHEYQRAA